jgi:hypothetical protein
MCYQKFFVCKNSFQQFTPLLLGPFKSVEEGFYCITDTYISEQYLLELWVLIFINITLNTADHNFIM